MWSLCKRLTSAMTGCLFAILPLAWCSSLHFWVYGVSPPLAQFSLLFIGINILYINNSIFNQIKAVLKHFKEVCSCFNTVPHSVEKDRLLLSPLIWERFPHSPIPHTYNNYYYTCTTVILTLIRKNWV